jgi:dTDP-4-dehydrorhamnose reductase
VSKSVAVLGAGGTLGSLICKNLIADGYTVYPITRKELELTDAAAVTEWLCATHPHTVINCATAGGKLTVKEVIYDDVRANVSLFLNFYNNSGLFSRFINVGSGAEFDTSTHVRLAKELDIELACPKTSYGFSKNVIARIILNANKFYTLRLLGCFDPSEPEFRILKKVATQDIVTIEDKQIDFISFADFYIILKHHIDVEYPRYKDINCVYYKKYNLSELVEKFKTINKLTTKIILSNNKGLDYTASGARLSSLQLSLNGIEKGFENYI